MVKRLACTQWFASMVAPSLLEQYQRDHCDTALYCVEMANSDLRIKLGSCSNDTLEDHKLDKVVDQWELVISQIIEGTG